MLEETITNLFQPKLNGTYVFNFIIDRQGRVRSLHPGGTRRKGGILFVLFLPFSCSKKLLHKYVLLVKLNNVCSENSPS